MESYGELLLFPFVLLLHRMILTFEEPPTTLLWSAYMKMHRENSCTHLDSAVLFLL